MADPRENFAYGTVLTAPSPATSGTSLVLGSGQGAGFPQPSTDGAFNVVIWPAGAQPLAANVEIARCTSRATDTLTLVRSTTTEDPVFGPRTVVVGDQVMLAVTKKTLDDLVPWVSTVPSGATPYEYLDRPQTFTGVVDYKRHQGHNVSSSVPGEPRYIVSSEDKYFDGVDTWSEWYVEQNWPAGETLQDGTTPVTGATTTSGSHTLPVGTITVGSTADFPSEGKIVIGGGFHGENGQLVTYTGKTGTTFTGCTGGSGVITTGTRVARFYSRPIYIQSLRNNGASDKHIIRLELGSGGGNLNIGAGPNRNVLVVDDVGRTFDLTGYSLRRNGTHIARLDVNAMGPASLPNLRAWNYDILHTSAGAGFGAAGDVMMLQIPWPDADTVAGIQLYLTAGGTTLTANQCLAGIYNQAGVLLATSVSQHTAWASTGLKNCLLTAPTLIPAGSGANPCVYVGMFWNGSAQPSLLKGLNNPPIANGANVAADKRFCRGATGATTALPTPITMSSRVDSTCSSFWVGLSV